MSIGPLRRLAGGLGLLALAPTAFLLAMDRVTPMDAALRAVVTLLAVMLLARAARLWVGLLIARYEREAAAAEESKPKRRKEDEPQATASAATASAATQAG